jgi:hypothetical protein
MSCCKKIFSSSQKYSDHYYKSHVPPAKLPSPPLNLSCISATTPKDGINEIELLSKAQSTSSSSTSQLVINESDSSDIISLDESSDKNYVPPQPATNFRLALGSQRLGTLNDNQGVAIRKRKTLSKRRLILFDRIPLQTEYFYQVQRLDLVLCVTNKSNSIRL